MFLCRTYCVHHQAIPESDDQPDTWSILEQHYLLVRNFEKGQTCTIHMIGSSNRIIFLNPLNWTAGECNTLVGNLWTVENRETLYIFLKSLSSLAVVPSHPSDSSFPPHSGQSGDHTAPPIQYAPAPKAAGVAKCQTFCMKQFF